MSYEVQAIIDNATRATVPNALLPGDVVSVVVPPGSTLEIHDLERYLPAPSRKRGVFRMFTTDSLASYVNAHKIDGTALYANVEDVAIVALINGHVPEADASDAGWGDHRATFRARLTPEWLAWTAIDGKMQTQPHFAEFLEDHVADIVTPTAAELLELAKTFEATTGVEFKSAVRLDNDQRQLTYVETVAAKAGQQGQLVVPETVELGIVPFEGADPYKMIARFRYRLTAGAVSFGVVLDRPDRVFRDAFDAVLANIETSTELTAFRGIPPE